MLINTLKETSTNIYDFYNTERQNILKLDRIIQKYYYDILNKEKLEKNKERLL